MKPLHLNLAARPYRDYRPVYAVVVVASILIALLMLNNIETYYRYKIETKTTRATIARLEAETEQERTLEATADHQLKNVNLAALDAETRFINARLAERAFSWSELLDRLETVVPRDVRIHSIAPTFGKNGLVHLEMLCDAKTTNGMLGTIVNLQSDPRFANPFPHNESASESGYSFSIGVDFKPTIARPVERQ